MIGNDCFYDPPVQIGDVLYEVFDDPAAEETPIIAEFRVRGTPSYIRSNRLIRLFTVTGGTSVAGLSEAS